jgi:hypothetical protein
MYDMMLEKLNRLKTKQILITIFFMIEIIIITNGQSFADTNYGAAAVVDDESLSLEAMLTYAIQDEYLARAEYELILDNFDVERPFSNIIRAEERHIMWLEPLFETYGYELPEDIATSYVILPEELADIYLTGVEAEINNIEMYAIFLNRELPADIELVFKALKNASENHLQAFERQTNQKFQRNTVQNAPNRGNLFNNPNKSPRVIQNR